MFLSMGRWIGKTTGALALIALLAIVPAAGASTRTATDSATGNASIAIAKAVCPGGQRATGGGFRTSPAPTASFPAAIPFESRKVGQRSWLVKAQEDFATSNKISLTAYVYCRTDAPKTAQRTKTASIVASGTGAFFRAAAKCGSAGKVQSGGYSSPAPVGAGNSTSQLVLDNFRLSKKTWSVRAIRGSIGAPEVTSYAYCAEPGHATRSRSRAATGSTNRTVQTRKCPTPVIGGGFNQPNATLTPNQLFFTPTESRRTSRRWQVTALHFQPGSTTLRALAYCL